MISSKANKIVKYLYSGTTTTPSILTAVDTAHGGTTTIDLDNGKTFQHIDDGAVISPFVPTDEYPDPGILVPTGGTVIQTGGTVSTDKISISTYTTKNTGDELAAEEWNNITKDITNITKAVNSLASNQAFAVIGTTAVYKCEHLSDNDPKIPSTIDTNHVVSYSSDEDLPSTDRTYTLKELVTLLYGDTESVDSCEISEIPANGYTVIAFARASQLLYYKVSRIDSVTISTRNTSEKVTIEDIIRLVKYYRDNKLQPFAD